MWRFPYKDIMKCFYTGNAMTKGDGDSKLLLAAVLLYKHIHRPYNGYCLITDLNLFQD